MILCAEIRYVRLFSLQGKFLGKAGARKVCMKTLAGKSEEIFDLALLYLWIWCKK